LILTSGFAEGLACVKLGDDLSAYKSGGKLLALQTVRELLHIIIWPVLRCSLHCEGLHRNGSSVRDSCWERSPDTSRQLNISAEMNLQTKFGEHRSFDAASAMRLLRVGSVHDLDVIRFMASHHLIARNPMEDGMHDRPLRRLCSADPNEDHATYFPERIRASAKVYT